MYIYKSSTQLHDSIQFDDSVQVNDSVQFDDSIQVGSNGSIQGPFGPGLGSATWRTLGHLKGGATRLESNRRIYI